MTTPRSDIEIQIFRESPNDHFLMAPNALHRGEKEWAGFTLRARAMLAAFLSLPQGWKITRKGIDAFAPELGREGMAAVLREMKERRVLYTRRVRVGGGRFTWEWRVFDRPQPADFTPFPDDVSAGRTMDGFAAHGESDPVDNSGTMDGFPVYGADQGEHGVSPGRTIDGSAVDGQPVVKYRRTGTSRRPKKEDLKNPSPGTAVSNGTAVTRAPATGGDSPQRDENWTERDERGAQVLGDLLTAFRAEPAPADEPADLDDSLADADPQDVADELANLVPQLQPAAGVLGRVARARVTSAAAAALRRGASVDDLIEAVSGRAPVDGVDDWGKLLATRLQRLAVRATRFDPRPTWCGVCDPRTRKVLVTVDCGGFTDERPAHCPTCSGVERVAA